MDKNYGYKHTKGFIVILVILILGMISVAYGQVVSGSVNTPSGYSIDSITGNLKAIGEHYGYLPKSIKPNSEPAPNTTLPMMQGQ